MAVKKSSVRKWILVLAFIVIVILAVAAVLISQGGPRGQQGRWGQRPGGKEESSGFVPGVPPAPPSGKVSVYKGFWMPASFYFDHKGQSMSDAKDLVAAGANIASIAPNCKK